MKGIVFVALIVLGLCFGIYLGVHLAGGPLRGINERGMPVYKTLTESADACDGYRLATQLIPKDDVENTIAQHSLVQQCEAAAAMNRIARVLENAKVQKLSISIDPDATGDVDWQTSFDDRTEEASTSAGAWGAAAWEIGPDGTITRHGDDPRDTSARDEGMPFAGQKVWRRS